MVPIKLIFHNVSELKGSKKESDIFQQSLNHGFKSRAARHDDSRALAPLVTPLTMADECDVLIIGAGTLSSDSAQIDSDMTSRTRRIVIRSPSVHRQLC